MLSLLKTWSVRSSLLPTTYKRGVSFSQLGIHPKLVQRLNRIRIKKATEIQEKVCGVFWPLLCRVFPLVFARALP